MVNQKQFLFAMFTLGQDDFFLICPTFVQRERESILQLCTKPKINNNNNNNTMKNLC